VEEDLILLAPVGGPTRCDAIALGDVPIGYLRDLIAARVPDATIASVELLVERAPALERALLGDGWRLAETEEQAMVLLDIPAESPPPPSELTVRRAMDEVSLADFWAVEEARPRHVPSAAAARDPEIAVLVGYCGGRPVATGRVSGHGSVADLMGIRTLPDLRGRGFGTAMTWAALAAARAMGCGAAVLAATAMGRPLYSRLGFHAIGTLRTYVPSA